MKKIYFLLLVHITLILFSQKTNHAHERGMVEDNSGKRITNTQEKENFLKQREKNLSLEKKSLKVGSYPAVEMCNNGGFEQHETISGSSYLKNFLYNIGDPPGPTQCKSVPITADSYIQQYDPSNTQVMATTVPANLVDQFMGNIKAFDQYALKINYTNSNSYGSVVQTKRFKTNNESFLKFNYKAVLQSVYDSSHTDNQAFFKGRILNKNNVVVSEFCLVGDEKNCIFTKVPDGSYGYVTLYTANWQSGILDISSIPNNEEFTVEFLASRCGLGGHFGYAYVDDICLLHSNENFIGSVTLDPLNAVCPTLPVSVCGSYTLPNSGGVTASLKKLTLKLLNESGTVVHTTSTTSSHDLVNKKFCFSMAAANFPNIASGNYNVRVTAEYDMPQTTECGSNNFFDSATSADPSNGWHISFQNCTSSCNIEVKTGKLSRCDGDKNGSEIFDLTNLESQVVTSATGLSFDYFKSYNDAYNNTNKIPNFTSFPSPSATLYVRVYKDAACFKIIPSTLEVKNPTANITGILNVCSGSTELTASAGSSYVWSTNETTQKITVNDVGTYSVTITDELGCSSTATVKIEPSQTAVMPTLEISQPNCFSSTGTIKVTSPASEYSFDDGQTWTTNPIKNNLYPGTYKVKIKTVKGCISYSQVVDILQTLTPYPYYSSENPKYCGDTGSITITSLSTYYSFDNGLTWVNTPTISNLSPGMYTLRTKDASGCISNPQVVLIESKTLGNPDYTVTEPACNVAGKIVIDTPSDFYTFDGGTTWVTSNTLDNLTSGNFSIGIKNALGCTSYFSYVYLQNFNNLYPEYEVIQPQCGKNGTIYIKTIGSEYSFDNGVTWTTSNLADLPSGTYNIKVKNENGCVTNSNTVYLQVSYLPSPFYTLVQPTCGSNGSITINSIHDYYSFDNGITWVTTNTKSLPEGSYQVKVKNSLGCESYSQYFTLYSPKISKPNVTVVQPTCATKGSITINTIAPFYSIDGGSTWVTTNVFNNLTGYSYNVLIKNNQNCISEDNYVYMNSTYLDEPTFVVVNPSCGNIGSITFTSTADYYSIDGGYTWTTNSVFNNLAEGSYYLMTKNNANCRSQGTSVYLDKTYLANPSYTVVQPGCATKGSITITNSASQYSIDSGNTWQTSNTFSNLSPGYYYLKIKNSTGCISNYTSVNLKDYYLPDPVFTSTQPTCGVGGTISISTPAAQYSIDGGNNWSTFPNFTNLADGYYYIVVKNSQGCFSNKYNTSLSLTKYYLPNPDVKITQPTCETKGSIKIMTTASQYSFDGGQTWTTNPELNNLTSGYYYIVIKNAQNCISNPYSMSVSINTFYLPRPLLKVVQPTCENTGSITVISTGAQYSYDNGQTWVNNSSLIDPAPGYYTILIKNSAGCISESAAAYINKFYLNSPSLTTVQPTCSNPSGSIFVNTVADLYSFDKGVTWTSNPVKNNLSSGSYYIVTKNAKGCISTESYAYISSPPTIPSAPVATVVQPTSCGATDGSITITTLADSYSFNDGASWTTNPVKKNIGAGTYIIKLKKNTASCESLSTAITLTSGQVIAAPDATAIQPTCSVATGSITVTTPAATYSFDNGLTFVYADTKTDLEPGVYHIKIKNSSGCISDVKTVTITKQAPLPAPAFSVSQPNCTNNLGDIKITTSAIEYSFDNGLTYQTSGVKNNLAPGTYNLIIKNSSGCISYASTVTINPQPITPQPPQVAVTQPAGCTSNSGKISVISPASFYSFDDGITWIANSSQDLAPGTYLVKIKLNNNGCPSEATSVTINAPQGAPSKPILVVSQPTSCTNPFGVITISSPAFEYSFDNGITFTNNPVSQNLLPGNYIVKVRNNTGCESESVSVSINIPSDTPVKPTAVIQQIDCVHTSATISINETASEYSIDNGVNWQTSNVFSGLNSGTYPVKIKNAKGCISESSSAIVNVFINNTPKPILNASQNFCIQNNATIQDISITGNTIKWYDAAIGGNLITSSTILQDEKTYFASQTIAGCESERNSVKIKIWNTAAPNGNSLQDFCISQNAKISDLILSGSNIKWYNQNIGGVVVPQNQILQDGTTYYASQTQNGCESVTRFPVQVKLVTSNIPATDHSTKICADGINPKKIKLSDYRSFLVSTPEIYKFDFYNDNNVLISTDEHTIPIGVNNFNVKISLPSGCLIHVKLSITLLESPVLNLPETAEFCERGFVNLNPGDGFTDYVWTFNGNPYSTQQAISASQAGIYEVTVTNSNNCKTFKSVKVSSATTPIIQEIKIHNNDVTILATGVGILEYSLNLSNWQTSNFFPNLPNGSYTIYVRSQNNTCAVAMKDFVVFKIPNSISPNDDGFNDDWKIEGIEKYPGSIVKVIDRNGKVVFQKTINGDFSWDGKDFGRPLHTGTYWYHITVADGRILTGFLLIKNRN